MTACVINGQRCTQCCQAIILNMPAHDVFKAMRKRNEFNSEIPDDLSFVGQNWVSISYRRAKKINPYMVERQRRVAIDAGHKTTKLFRKTSYWTCKNLTASGCGVYEDRPSVCRDYPVYPVYSADYVKELANRPAEYHPECTEWPRIEAVNV